MLLKGAYCVGEHFVDPQSLNFINTDFSNLSTYIVFFVCWTNNGQEIFILELN